MKQRTARRSSRFLICLATVAISSMGYGCAGSDGENGAPGVAGTNGTNGTNAPIPGAFYTVFNGSPVSTQGGVELFHGAAVALAGELEGSAAATVTITGATADAAGLATVTFTITDALGAPLTGRAAIASTASFAIASLAPASGTENYNKWVPYIYNPTATVNQAYRERNSAPGGANPLVESPAGTYTYTFAKNLSTATYPIGGAAITYDRTRTHRVLVALRSGYVGGTTFDFVPAGGAISETRDIVEDATCRKCHKNTPGHYGPWDGIAKACVMCHSPGSFLANSAANGGATYSLQASEMIHRIHAGRELDSAPGPDGIYFDDPATAANEATDNGTYNLGGLSATWRSAAFPAVIENCVVCHTGAGAQVDNWMNVPSRAACGSCHDLIDWTAATGTAGAHSAGAQATDAGCAGCHPASGSGFGQSVESAHNWTAKDIRNVPEFDVALTTDTPARGFYIAGETPVITIELTARETDATAGYTAGVLIDHTKVIEDPSGEGCVPSADMLSCTNAADGLFRNANLYVTGPRANRIHVLTTAARAKVSSASSGPWDLSAGGSLRVIVDGGNFIVKFGHIGEDVLVSGDITLTLPAGTLTATATAADVVAWLNGPDATFDYNEREFLFSDRAIAYVENGLVSIRSRAVGSFNPSIQVPEASKSLGIFTDTAVKVSGSAAQVRQRTVAANNDPKAVFTTGNITYTLDPVDDLVPGTYMINVEFADRGRPSAAANYRTPSVAVATFQVKQAAVEAPIADNCTACHWSTNAVGEGVGFVLDPVRHNKPFNAQAIDQCAGCHSYKSGETVAARTWTTGGGTKPISKRVHAVHRGTGLNYPVLTVDHEESVPGRNWQITFPQDIRNCESCHSAATSGGWANVPNRLACMGCHDADGAQNHMKSQVWDPTPTAPWSGDEAESCAACH